MEKYLLELNAEQRSAVELLHGPLIILAGAGSGKTKTLVARVVHLIRNGVSPQEILAVTFTNKAAKEMKERVGKALYECGIQSLDNQWAQPWMGFSYHAPEVSTFHSFCVKLLRAEASRLGFSRPFVIYDDSDQLSLIKKIVEYLNISEKFGNPKRYQGAINQAKCQALGPDQLERQEFSGPFGDYLVNVYKEYENTLRTNCAFDFGDLIVKAYELIRDNPDLLNKYQDKFKYLMIDEYQDTNRAQYLLISLLAKKYRNLCVVGDEDQSIYKWRGADIKNILDFQNEYTNAKLIKLEQNYRSTKIIIEAASHVIRNNATRYDKTLWTENPEGEKIKWTKVSDERAEAEYVARDIETKLRRDGRLSYRDIAIFYRSHAQSRALEEALRKTKLPHEIIGGVGFYERKEIKDILAYLRVLVNPEDSVSLERIINVPARGIGKTTIEKLNEQAYGQQKSLWNVLKTNDLAPTINKKLTGFVSLIEQLTDTAKRENILDMYHRVLDATGYVAELKAEDSEESKGRIENLEELETVIQFFEKESVGNASLESFINQITLESSLLEKSIDSGAGAVSMMTLHSSKGLEFPIVYMVGCEEGIFPSKRAIDEADWEQDAIEEERRLCYVGMTRAERELTMLSTQLRRIYGQIQMSAPSRFIGEIHDSYLEKIDLSEFSGNTGSRIQSWSERSEASTRGRSFPSASSESQRYDYSESQESKPKLKTITHADGSMSVGQRVKHPSYGSGTIFSLEGSESDRKITIEFTGKVRRKFLLKHVQLEIL